MKKVILLTALVVLMAAPSMALIRNSKHNLGITGTGAYHAKGAATSEICIYCHTPHNATVNYPLWNRANGSVTALYSSETLAPGGKPVASNLVTTLKCLSCHDGSQGLAGGVVQKFGKELTGTGKMSNLGSAGMASPANLGTDLSNDHPVGMSYSNAVAGDLKIRATGAAAGGGLPAGPLAAWFRGTNQIMECASCHDVHYSVENGTKFLRRTNGTSMLCLTCHDK